MMHNLLEISLAPSVPASLRNIKLLESLWRASFTSVLALEHLQDFIYYPYTSKYLWGPSRTTISRWK